MSDISREPPAHGDFRDDLAAYALGALKDDEAERLRRHLETCDECRQQLRWLMPAVALLPRTVEQLEPPARLREGLMAAVRAESPAAAEEPPRRAGTGRWHSLSAALWRPATAVAAGAMLLAGLVAGYFIHQPGEGTKPTSSVFAAHAAPSAPGASGVLARQGGSAILRVDGMPSLARNQVYEVWVKRDGTLQPSSLFALRKNRSGDAAVPGPLNGADAVLVTKEPRGGTRQPTTAPVLSVQLH